MPVPLYAQNVVAFIWDFDRTLIPGNQQDPLFDEYDVDGPAFWTEVDGLVEYYRSREIIISRDLAYLLHILSYVDAGVFEGLTNAKLRELGSRLTPNPGIPDFFDATRRQVATVPEYAAQGEGPSRSTTQAQHQKIDSINHEKDRINIDRGAAEMEVVIQDGDDGSSDQTHTGTE